MITTVAQGASYTAHGIPLYVEELPSLYSKAIVEDIFALEATPLQGTYTPPLSISFSTNKTLPSVVQAPVLELKPLPYYLKYVFLGDNETLPVIVSSALTSS